MNKIIFPILRLLSDGNFYSDILISHHLNCPLTEVYKALSLIDSLGIRLTMLSEQRFLWEDPIQWLNPDSILLSSGNASRFFNLEILDFANSTNTYLLNKFQKKPAAHNSVPVVAAELQTNGRGRLNRKWYSGLGDSLTFSLRWNFKCDISFLSGLSLVVGLAIIRVLNTFSVFNVNIKWPNDILSNYKKLAGVLIDFRGGMHGTSHAVIGIGINFNLSNEIKSLIEQDVTDLLTISGKNIDRNNFLGALLNELYNILIKFNDYGFKHFKQEWLSYHAYEGRKTYLTLPDRSIIEGIVDGIGDDGSLCLITNKGENLYHAGDISICMKSNDTIYIGN